MSRLQSSCIGQRPAPSTYGKPESFNVKLLSVPMSCSCAAQEQSYGTRGNNTQERHFTTSVLYSYHHRIEGKPPLHVLTMQLLVCSMEQRTRRRGLVCAESRASRLPRIKRTKSSILALFLSCVFK
mmetsp:Transcript_42172/g.98404  ORF Transcript_42172/g.98404 Transcript_42172/m.98404 type:complete len:126 (+) Transcript_42172:181-558(+)